MMAAPLDNIRNLFTERQFRRLISILSAYDTLSDEQQLMLAISYYHIGHHDKAYMMLTALYNANYTDPLLLDFIMPLADWHNDNARALDILKKGHARNVTSNYFTHFAGEFLLRHGRISEGFSIMRQGQHEYIDILRPYIAEWTGQDLAHKHLLLIGNLGYGDQFMALRYIHYYLPASCTITLRVDDIMYDIIRHNMPPNINVESKHEPLVLDSDNRSIYDYMQGLYVIHDICGHVYGQSPPANTPIYSAPPSYIKKWQNLCAPFTHKPSIGLILNGRFGDDWGFIHTRRAVSGALWQFLHDYLPYYNFIVAHPPPYPDDIAAIYTSLNGLSLSPHIKNFADSAALMSQCQHVISVDTSAIHLAGLLHIPSVMVNRYDSCWRWHPFNKQNSWYPALTIINQTQKGEWAPVLSRVENYLRHHANT